MGGASTQPLLSGRKSKSVSNTFGAYIRVISGTLGIMCRLHFFDRHYIFLHRLYNLSLKPYYMGEEGEDSPFICSMPRENGMLHCKDVPPSTEDEVECSLPAPLQSSLLIGSFDSVGGASVNGCVNWNQYYNNCSAGDLNPHKGAVNFDNIGYASIAIFQVREMFKFSFPFVQIEQKIEINF